MDVDAKSGCPHCAEIARAVSVRLRQGKSGWGLQNRMAAWPQLHHMLRQYMSSAPSGIHQGLAVVLHTYFPLM